MADQAMRFNSKKAPLEFILDFPFAMEAFAKVCQEGAKKYKRDNWKAGRSLRETNGSVLRHLFSHHNGQDYDPEFLEKGELVDQLAQVMWNAAAQIEWLKRHGDKFDDRDKSLIQAKEETKVQEQVREESSGVVG